MYLALDFSSITVDPFAARSDSNSRLADDGLEGTEGCNWRCVAVDTESHALVDVIGLCALA
jgi:hypothetical protein